MAVDQAKYGIGQYGSAKYGEIPAVVEAPAYRNEDGAVYGLATYGTDSYGSGSVTIAHTGVEAKGNIDYAGAANNAWWLPDMGNYDVVVTGFNGATEVFADGVSLGSTSGAGNTLTITQAQYADKLITTDKPADFSYPDGRANAIPTSWAGTEFITRSTRYGSYYKIWSISGTATVQIFKDGTLDTTAKVTNGTQYDKSFADDASDPEYRIKSDLPILVFESGSSAGGQDSNPLFPSTSDDLYGVGSGTTYFFRDEGYGGTGVNVTEYRSNGGSSTSSVSTVKSFAGTSSDFVPPASRIVSSVKGGTESLADGDGGESIRFVPAGAMAHEFILGELAEFVGFVGEPGTVGRYIRVYNSSGTLLDTIQLEGDGGANFPSYAQIISATTTESALTGNAKSYNLSAGTKFVSDVPVMGMQEDDSSNDEHNFFGLRHFAGFVTGEASVTLPAATATGSVNAPTISGDSSLSLTGVSATATADPDLVIEADATHTLTSVQGTSATSTVGTVGVAIHEVTGVEGTGQTSTVTTTADSNLTTASVSATSSANTVTTTADNNTSVTGAVGDAESLVNITAAVTGVEATATAGEIGVFTGLFVTVEVTGLEATGSVTTATVTADAVADNLTGLEATSTVNDTLTFIGDANFTLPSTEVTGQVATATTSGSSNTTSESAEGTGQTTTATVSGDANFALTSVEGTGEVTTVAISLPKNVDVTGVATTGSVTTATITGTSDTTLPSVSVTGTADPDVVIEGDSLHTITSVQGVSANGGIGDVTAGANVDSVTGVEATGSVETVTVSIPKTVDLSSVTATVSANDVVVANFVLVPSVDAVAEIGDVVVTADSSLTVSSTEATASVSDVTVIANSVVVITSPDLTSAVDDATIVTEQNIFDANNREHRRVVYVKQDIARLAFVSNEQSRVVFVPQDVSRIVNVPEEKPRVVSIPQDKPRITYVRAA